MNPDQWRKVTAAFHGALARDRSTRAAFIDDACDGDAAVRAEVERLLAAHHNAGQFGEVPVITTLGESPVLMPAPAAPTDVQVTVDFDSASSDSASRHSDHPFLWFTRAAALVALVAFTYGAWLILVNKGITKEFGWSEARQRGQWWVASAGPTSDGLQIGDRILALNGAAPFGGGGTSLHRRQLRVGERYRLTLERSGERLERTLTVRAGPKRLAHYLVYFFMTLIWCAVGVFIGLAGPP
jgi:hypothetical protein